MQKSEALEIIKKYVIENFDHRLDTNPLYIKEFPDYFQVHLNSKRYANTGNLNHSIVGLGSTFISKKFKEITQYGSLPHGILEDFLTTEHQLGIVRTKYKIDRADYDYDVTIKNITNLQKAIKYINGILMEYNRPSIKEIQNKADIKISTLYYFKLLQLLYFNTIDPFCEIFYQKKPESESGNHQLRPYTAFNKFHYEDTFFHMYMLEQVNRKHSTFKLDKAYRANISKINNKDLFLQYIPIVRFSYYGYDDNTGYTGYISYSHNTILNKIETNTMSFEYVKASNILFFLFINTLNPFCKIEFDRAQDIVDS